MSNSLALPLYASKPRRKIPGTRCVAVTMYRSDDGSVAEYAVFTADGEASLGTAHFQPASRFRSRGYAMEQFPRLADPHWRNLTEFAIEMGKRLDVEVKA